MPISTDVPSEASHFDEFRRRTFTKTKMLNLGNDLLRDEARRLRDLLSFYVVPRLGDSRRLPTEDELAREFHCSRNSARAALKLLSNEHAIQRVTGVGTYAREAPRQWRSDMLRDSPSYQAEHRTETTLVGWHVQYEAPETMREAFADDVTRVVVFEKRQTYDGVPGVLRTFFVPLRAHDTLGPEDVSEDLMSILEDRFGHRPLKASRTVAAIAADESAAASMEVPLGAPLLLIQTAVYGADGSLVLLYFVRQRSEIIQLSVEPERIV